MKTLEELMEMCGGEDGQRFRWLKNNKTHWTAQARPKHTQPMQPDIKAEGRTAYEAVENLLIAIKNTQYE